MSWLITGSQKVNWDPSLISTAQWLDAADKALYTSNADGRNRVTRHQD
jgi:PleD family two-component response regulator